MSGTRQVGTALLAFVGAYFLARVLMMVLPFGGSGGLAGLVSLVAAAVAARWAWLNADEVTSSVRTSAALGGIALGGLGFLAGFFGPLIFAPEANQGPLLGIFITGPAGVVIGAIGGALYARRRDGR